MPRKMGEQKWMGGTMKKGSFTIPAAPRLRGGDDRKIYYLDDQGRDHCISEKEYLL